MAWIGTCRWYFDHRSLLIVYVLLACISLAVLIIFVQLTLQLGFFYFPIITKFGTIVPYTCLSNTIRISEIVEIVLHTMRSPSDEWVTEIASNLNCSLSRIWQSIGDGVTLYHLGSDIFFSQRIRTWVSLGFYIVIYQESEFHSLNHNLGLEVTRDFISKSHDFIGLTKFVIAQDIDTDKMI